MYLLQKSLLAAKVAVTSVARIRTGRFINIISTDSIKSGPFNG